jgi:Concanavalin A-like lectin/glucanases superfamily
MVAPLRLLPAIAVLACAGHCVAAFADEAPCTITFDGTLATDRGDAPTIAEGVGFVPGHSRQAALMPPGARLAYPTAGNYDPKRGTIDLWVRPTWDSATTTGDRLFWVVDNDPGQANRTALGFWGNGTTAFIYLSNDQGFDAITAPITWHAGEWHHLSACWDESLHARALYVDGERRGVTGYVRDLPSRQEVFHLGYLPGTAQGQTDGLQADAAIDDFRLYASVEPADFAEAARAIGADLQSRLGREKALQRLRTDLTLERVARDHIEAGWEDLAGLPPPFTKRVPIQVRYHPDVVFAQPDLSIALGRADDALGVGFALGVPARLPDIHEVTRRLHRGYQPILESEWRSGPLLLRQTAFCTLPGDEETTTGRERQYVVVRLAVANEGEAPQTTAMFLLVGRMNGSQSTNYGPFTAPVSRWQTPLLGLTAEADALLLDGRIVLTYHADGPAPASLHAEFDNGPEAPARPAKLTNCLRFDLELQPKETRAIDLVVASRSDLLPAEERARMASSAFDAALARAEAYWDRGLSPAMKLVTPEPRLNDIYRALVLSCLANISRNPDRPWDEPYQSPFLAMVWPWEFAHMAIPLTSVGYGKELERSLRFFTDRQVGVGRYAETRSPEGDVLSTRGVYVGSSLYWMCETGAVLWAMAEHYRYTHDAAWLQDNRPSILAAWEWIARERARTRLRYDDGRKVEYYGLLPKGRVHDWEGWRYHFGFTDNFTWKGMSEMAAAFREAGLPEADRLTHEADEYRRCILEVTRRAQFADPDTNLLFIPNTVYYREGSQGGLWWADGPQPMFATGLLRPSDPRFTPMVQYVERKWGMLAGLSGHMDPDPSHPYWYVNQTERGYFANYLARGEIEKALLVFYSNLFYGLSHDTYQTCERIDVRDGNYAPFQPNASGNGRMIEMIRRMIVDEEEPGVLWLLRGCPRRWFAPGQVIAVSDAPTHFGKLALRTETTGGTIVAEIDAPDREPPRRMNVVLRDPERRPRRSVTVNGKPARVTGETVTLRAPRGHLRVVCDY